MNLRQVTLKTVAHNWKPYVNLTDEQLEKKINFLYAIMNITVITGMIVSIIVPLAIYIYLENIVHEIPLITRIIWFLVSFLTLVAGTIFINKGNQNIIKSLKPVKTSAILTLKLDNLKRINVEVKNWCNEIEANGRSLRVFDIEVMETLKSLDQYYKEAETKALYKKLDSFKGVKEVTIKQG